MCCTRQLRRPSRRCGIPRSRGQLVRHVPGDRGLYRFPFWAGPFDATMYSAISFWVAVGPTVPEPFEQPLGLTTMDNAWNGGICPTTPKNLCMDYYATTVKLTRTWQRFVIKFSDLKQGNFGT